MKKTNKIITIANYKNIINRFDIICTPEFPKKLISVLTELKFKEEETEKADMCLDRIYTVFINEKPSIKLHLIKCNKSRIVMLFDTKIPREKLNKVMFKYFEKPE